MERDPNQRPLKALITEMMKQYKLEDKYYEVGIEKAWREIMGPVIADRTTDLKLKDGTLYIKLGSAPLREELAYGREKIRELLNEHFGRELVQEVRL